MTATTGATTRPAKSKSKSYKLVPPDGGWGILVCIGMAFPFISGLSSLPSFGLVFGDFLKSIGAETSSIAIITSTFFCAMSFAGLFSGSLFRKYGMRRMGLVGGGLYCLGTALQVFATSTLDLLLTFSLLQGVGFGLIVPTCYTTFNNYFVLNRVMWMGFAQTLIGLGAMAYPIAMQKLLEWYGFRGCLLVLTGINAHAVLGMLLMQPVEWHMKRVPLDEEELQLQQQQPSTPSQPVVVHVQPETPLKPIPELEFATESEVRDSLPVSHLSSRRVSSHAEEHALQILRSRASSITSLGNWTGSMVVSDASPQMMHSLQASRRQSVISGSPVGEQEAAAPPAEVITKKSLCGTIVDFLDLTLLKQPVYVNIVLGITFALYSDITFFTMQPTYLFELGYTKVDTAKIIAIGASADLLSRIFLAVTAIFIQVPARYIYLGGALFTVFARFAFDGITDFMGMACVTAVLGFLRTWIHVPLPLVFADYLPKERFASGYGLFMFTHGNGMFLIGPIVGYIRDRTQDYILVFHILNVFMALCAFPWVIEVLIIKFRRRSKLARNNVGEQSNGNNTLAH
ncbi:monocarboxylate transporter 7 [Drosophila sulfurigaster albostrigata]|uniref:monocarboxylate transporter 7 n=1 Tax=Drosophila sulfurigaster albostrigata TaxID=89887 RepID=UPI002D21B2BF|nr:monocarboxylate transporter 7 [Drosophila sulfurigaster albostrigata]